MLRTLVFSLTILLYGMLNYWVGLRMWQLIGKFIPYLPNALYWFVFWFIAMSFITGRLGEKYFSQKIFLFLTLLGYYWMATMVYLAIVLSLLELVRLADQRLAFLPRGVFGQFPAAPVLGLGVIMIVLVVVGYGWWNARNPQVIHYDINIPKQAGILEQLHVVAVSDLHLGNIVDNKRLAGLVDMIITLNPDIILLPGDIVDGDPQPFIKQDMDNTLCRLAPRYGIYAVPGNHEYLGGNFAEIITNLKKTGIEVLRDEVVLVEDSFYLVGRDDIYGKYYTGIGRKDLQSVVGGIAENNALPIIVLDHQPVNLDEPGGQDMDLQISGHTHHGQFFPFNMVTDRIFEVDQGYLRKGDLQVIVSTGFGTWGPPIRVGSRSEILDIQITFSSLYRA